MSAFWPAMTHHYLLKPLNQLAYTEWAFLVVYTLHVLAGFCFRFWVTNPMCTVKELHRLPVDRTIASYPALWTFTPTTPSYFQWICFGFFAKQVRGWLWASSCLPEYPSVCHHETEKLLPQGFLWNFVFRVCIKICRSVLVLVKISQEIKHFPEYRLTFPIVSVRD